jgi:hypothetical protein
MYVSFTNLNYSYFKLGFNFKELSVIFLNSYKRVVGEGFLYIRGLLIVFIVDACITDDEPL